jgi:hypothetical protein
MSELLEVLSSLESSGSGSGVSYYATRCPEQARLDKKFPRPSSFNAGTGTVFHKLMELYYGQQLVNVVLPLDDSPDPKDPVQEALRLFAGYTNFFPSDEWSVIAVEKLLPVEGDDRMKAAIEHAMGVSPFTARLDMVVSINPEQAAAMSERRRIDILPGNYIVDHKTKDKKDHLASIKYSRKAQFIAYQTVWNIAFGDIWPVQGLIVNDCVRHKNLTADSFQTYLVPPPSEVQVAGLRKWLQWKELYLKMQVFDWDACDDWGGCQHWVTGNCQRV